MKRSWHAFKLSGVVGVSLLELLIVLVVLSVLLMLTVPLYSEQVFRGRRIVASSALLAIAGRQEAFMLYHRRYAVDLAELGFSKPQGVGLGHDGQEVESTPLYELSLAPVDDPYQFRLVARPVGPQAGDMRCGTYTLNATGVAANTGSAGPDVCW